MTDNPTRASFACGEAPNRPLRLLSLYLLMYGYLNAIAPFLWSMMKLIIPMMKIVNGVKQSAEFMRH